MEQQGLDKNDALLHSLSPCITHSLYNSRTHTYMHTVPSESCSCHRPASTASHTSITLRQLGSQSCGLGYFQIGSGGVSIGL